MLASVLGTGRGWGVCVCVWGLTDEEGRPLLQREADLYAKTHTVVKYGGENLCFELKGGDLGSVRGFWRHPVPRLTEAKKELLGAIRVSR